MKLPRKSSDDWVYGALLASVLVGAAGLHGTWLREARPVATEARAPAASAVPTTLVAATPRHVATR